MTDPVSRLALARAVLISADIEEQLTARNEHGTRPLVAVLAKARREAAEALTLLVDVDPNQPADVTKLQNEVRRFADLVRWLKEIVAAGLDDRFEVNDAERDELEDGWASCLATEGWTHDRYIDRGRAGAHRRRDGSFARGTEPGRAGQPEPDDR